MIFLLVLGAMVVGMAANPSPVAAKRVAQFGIQGGWGSDNLEWFLGGRAELGASKIFKNSRAVFDFNWHWPEGSFKYYEFDLNYLWPLTALTKGGDSNDLNYLWPLTALTKGGDSNLYIGGGFNVGRGWVEGFDANWEFGLNALAGFNWDLGGRAAFVEGGYKFITDFDHWFIGAGFLF
jgi:hypothetical protein